MLPLQFAPETGYLNTKPQVTGSRPTTSGLTPPNSGPSSAPDATQSRTAWAILEAPVLSHPATEPEQGETAITDFGTPSEHASEVVAQREVATFGDPDPPPSREGVPRVLAFLIVVAGGRMLLHACRELADAGAY